MVVTLTKRNITYNVINTTTMIPCGASHRSREKTTFDGLNLSLAVGPRGHKQRKLNDHVYSFVLFVFSTPHYKAEL